MKRKMKRIPASDAARAIDTSYHHFCFRKIYTIHTYIMWKCRVTLVLWAELFGLAHFPVDRKILFQR